MPETLPVPPRHHEEGIDRFLRIDPGFSHVQRARAMLKDHPELKDLIGPTRSTFPVTVGIVAAQLALAWAAPRLPWWGMLVLAYTVGAALSHACYVVIHEATHNLMARRRWLNHLGGFLANLVLLAPSYGPFRKFHHLHHRYIGDYRADADLPSVVEARLVGRSSLRKALWLLFYPLTQTVRTKRLVRYPLWDRLVVLNVVVTVLCDVALWLLLGPWSCLYLLLALFFSIGLHPLGARWIQEHYVFRRGQSTYSCYSRMNPLQLNIGYHVEHHDMPSVAWNRLPDVRRVAHGYYDDLHAHTSWTRLLLTFLFSPRVTLFTRYVRPESNAHCTAIPAREVTD